MFLQRRLQAEAQGVADVGGEYGNRIRRNAAFLYHLADLLRHPAEHLRVEAKAGDGFG